MRALSLGASAFALVLSAACNGDPQPALRDATEVDLPKLVLQQEDVPGGTLQATTCSGSEDSHGLGGASKSYSVAFDLRGSAQGQISCLDSTVGLYGSAYEALSYLRGLDAAYFEGEQPAQAPPDLVAEKINVPKLGDYASGFLIKSTCPQGVECSEPEFRIYNIQIQQGNVRSLITISSGPDEDVVERAIEYAEKQRERIETVLGQPND